MTSEASVLQVVTNNRLLFLAVPTAGAIVGMALMLVIPPTYQSSAQLIVGTGALENENRAQSGHDSLVNSVVHIARSKAVITRAVSQVGLMPLAYRKSGKPVTNLNQAAEMAGLALSVKAEPNSDVITVSFKHERADVATDFANAIASKFVERDAELQYKVGASELLSKLQAEYEAELRSASMALNEFAVKNSTYLLAEQRRLALSRQSELQSLIARQDALIAERQARIDIIKGQLPEMRSTPADIPAALTSELMGFVAFRDRLDVSLRAVWNELSRLSSHEIDFELLSRRTTVAHQNLESLARRRAELQLNDEVSAARLSSVRILQAAVEPLEPVFPRLPQMLALGFAAGLVLSFALGLFLEFRRKSSNEEEAAAPAPGMASVARDFHRSALHAAE